METPVTRLKIDTAYENFIVARGHLLAAQIESLEAEQALKNKETEIVMMTGWKDLGKNDGERKHNLRFQTQVQIDSIAAADRNKFAAQSDLDIAKMAIRVLELHVANASAGSLDQD